MWYTVYLFSIIRYHKLCLLIFHFIIPNYFINEKKNKFTHGLFYLYISVGIIFNSR